MQVVGGESCVTTEHNPDRQHTELWCQYPTGTRADETVWVMNAKGGTTPSARMGKLSYTQCQPGFYQSSLACSPVNMNLFLFCFFFFHFFLSENTSLVNFIHFQSFFFKFFTNEA